VRNATSAAHIAGHRSGTSTSAEESYVYINTTESDSIVDAFGTRVTHGLVACNATTVGLYALIDNLVQHWDSRDAQVAVLQTVKSLVEQNALSTDALHNLLTILKGIEQANLAASSEFKAFKSDRHAVKTERRDLTFEHHLNEMAKIRSEGKMPIDPACQTWLTLRPIV
jgi:hypothetical protein